jgi:hypothetical protein
MPTLACIVEKPRQHNKVLKSSYVASSGVSTPNTNYMFLDSSSDTSSSVASPKALLALAQVPSYVSPEGLDTRVPTTMIGA